MHERKINSNFIKVIMSFVLVLLFFVGTYVLYVQKQVEEKERILDFNIDTSEEYGNNKGCEINIVQDFTSNKPLSGVSLSVSSNQHKNVKITILNKDNSDVVYEGKINTATITGNELKIDFSNYNTEGENYHYSIIINYINSRNNIVCFLGSKYNQYPNGDLDVNGEVQEGDLSFKLITQNNNQEILKWYFALGCFIIIILIIAAVVFLQKANWKIENIFLIFALLFGAIYMIIMPVNSAPDSIVHSISTYHYSNVLLGIEDDVKKNKIFMRAEDVSMQNLYDKQPDVADYQKLIYFAQRQERNTELTEVETDGVAKFPLLYVPGIIGITIARLANLKTIYLILFGEFCNLLAYILLAYLSMRIIPWGKKALFVAGLSPMTLSLGASFSYDAVLISLSWLFLSMVLEYAYTEKRKFTKKNIIILFVVMLLLIPQKAVYCLFALLPLLISANQSLKQPRKWCALCIGMLVCAAVICLLYNLATVVAISGDSVEYSSEQIITYSVEGILKNPVKILLIFFNTTMVNAFKYIKDMFGYTLGWWDFNVNEILIGCILIVFLLSCAIDSEENCGIEKVSGWHIFLILSVCAGIYGLVALSMMLSFTPENYVVIAGIQGRYFLPLIPLIMLLLSKLLLKKKIRLHLNLMYLNVVLQCLTIIDIAQNTLTR